MEIIFSGGSHYGANALISLFPHFNKIFLLKNNPPDILDLKRESDETIDDFSSSNCPYVFLGGHAPFITKEQLSQKTYINVHGSLLPKYRGMHPTFWAIMNEEKELGVTFHLVDEYMDSGNILTQYSFPYNGQPVTDINKTIGDMILLHAGKDISAFMQGEIIPEPQKHETAIFSCKRNLNDCLIDFCWNNKTINLFFQALTTPYPLPRIRLKNITYEVLEYEQIKQPHFSAVGRVLNIDKRGIWIRTSEGFLIVSRVREVETNLILDPRTLVKIGYRVFPNDSR